METLRSDTLCTSDSMRSLPHINPRIDELSKEKEDFLCGTDEEGDEEEALSDDSLRLRLSEDEEEIESVSTSALDDQDPNPETNRDEVRPEGKGDIESTPVPTSEKNNTPVQSEMISEEGQYSGNDVTDDNVLIVHERKGKENIVESKKLQLDNMFRPWPRYEWRVSRSNNRPYRNRYTISSRYCRPQPYEYRRYSAVIHNFKRGKGNGMVNPHNTTNPPHKAQNYASDEPCELSNSSGSDQSTESEPITSTSLKSDIIMDVIEVIETRTGQDTNTLNDESSVSNDGNYKIKEKSFNENNSVNNLLKLEHNLEDDSKIIASKNDKCTDVVAANDTKLNDKSNEQVIESSSISVSNNVNHVQIDKTINDNTDSKDLYNFDNSNQVELSNVHNKSETLEFVKKHNVSNDNQCEISVSINSIVNLSEENKEIELDKQDLGRDTELADGNQKTELSENNCTLITLSTTIDKEIAKDELKIDEETANNEIEQSNENKRDTVIVQSLKSHKIHEDEIISNDLINSKDNNEVIPIQNNVPGDLATAADKCDDTQLRNSDNSKSSIEIRKLVEDESIQSKTKLQQGNENATEKGVKLAKKENEVTNVTSKIEQKDEKGNKESKISEENSLNVKENVKNNFLGFVAKTKNDSKDDNVKKNDEVLVPTRKRRRRTKKMMLQEAAPGEDTQVIGRQKRRTAKNAEEIIRKKFLSNDTDSESSDGSDKFVPVNYKMNITPGVRPLSPPSLKRTGPDNHVAVVNGSIKRPKVNQEVPQNEVKERNVDLEKIKRLNYVRKFFHRDLNEKLPKIKQEEFEELLIQKIVETITMRDEIGKLREQARISERNQEIMRAKCQQLAKQVKDFEMVLSRNAADRRAHNDKTVPPIKINRSVGLQVNFLVDHGMQNLRQLQQNSNIRLLHVSNNTNTPNTPTSETNNAISPRRGIKVRSPRRTDLINGQAPTISQNNTTSPNVMTTITPAALVVTKPVDTQHSLSLPNQSNVQPIIPNQQPQQTVALNGKLPNHVNRQAPITTNVVKPHTNDLIDLTDEEEKNKVTSAPVVTTTTADQQINITQKPQPQQQCYPRVIQTIPNNVAITNHQLPSLRVVQPASQPTPTALVNNMNAPRLAYVMPPNVGSRQLLITPTTSTMRPVTTCRPPYAPTIAYKAGISTVANETARVLTTSAAPNVQMNKHPAPLPDVRNYTVNPHWKLPPPAPSLKISKVANGIVLSWNMTLSDKYADIASYQLYAYQEVNGVAPSTSLWKKVGDVRALPLPMACSLTQFSEGNNYYFAVRAVDTHSRKGQYSIPGNISL